MKRVEKRKSSFLAIMAVVAICAGIVMYVFVHEQMKRMEQGVLDVCATQQDAYVQLVLDQINLKQNRNNEEIIVNILVRWMHPRINIGRSPVKKI